eukprot:7384835-Prymnesium_polylepis.2
MGAEAMGAEAMGAEAMGAEARRSQSTKRARAVTLYWRRALSTVVRCSVLSRILLCTMLSSMSCVVQSRLACLVGGVEVKQELQC